MCYHVINRGNNRSKIFHKDQDYLRFTEMLGEAVERQPHAFIVLVFDA